MKGHSDDDWLFQLYLNELMREAEISSPEISSSEISSQEISSY